MKMSRIVLLQLKDVLQTYNKVTELCFERCASNVNYRSLTPDEVCSRVNSITCHVGHYCDVYEIVILLSAHNGSLGNIIVTVLVLSAS